MSDASRKARELLRKRIVQCLESSLGLAHADVEQLCDAFESAIAPVPLHTAVNPVTRLERMVQLFLSRRDVDDMQLREKIVNVWSFSDGQQIDQLISRVELQRFRTLDEDEWQAIAANCERWGPVVRYFEDSEFAGRCPGELVGRINELVVSLTRSVARSVGGGSRPDVEDAIQQTIVATLSSRVGKYRYQGSFPAWLRRSAVRRYQRAAAQRRVLPWDEHQNGSRVVLSSTSDGDEFELEMRERFEFVKGATFQKHAVVNEVWRAMIDSALTDETPNDAAIAQRVNEVSELQVSAGTIATNRRHLRQRLLAAMHVLNYPDDGEIGDDAVLQLVEKKHGLEDKAVVTVRRVAALCRASRDDRSLVDVTQTALLLDQGNKDADAGRFAQSMLERKSGVDIQSAQNRLQGRRDVLKKHRSTIDELFTHCRSSRLSHLASSVAHLIAGGDVDADRICSRLQLVPEEQKPVVEFLQSQGMAGSGKNSASGPAKGEQE